MTLLPSSSGKPSMMRRAGPPPVCISQVLMVRSLVRLIVALRLVIEWFTMDSGEHTFTCYDSRSLGYDYWCFGIPRNYIRNIILIVGEACKVHTMHSAPRSSMLCIVSIDVMFHGTHQFSVSLSSNCKTSYCTILQNNDAAKYGFRMILSPWHLTKHL